jgi:hypothetical protein
LKPTKQNQKKHYIQNSQEEKQYYLQQQKQLCSQNGFSGLDILCCIAIQKKRSFGNAKLLPIPSYSQGGNENQQQQQELT